MKMKSNILVKFLAPFGLAGGGADWHKSLYAGSRARRNTDQIGECAG